MAQFGSGVALHSSCFMFLLYTFYCISYYRYFLTCCTCWNNYNQWIAQRIALN
jgi:hypothetical protein